MAFWDKWRQDIGPGFSVALVALPLSIGIALASGAPASAGLIAAVIGGVLGSWMGGSQLTINGPAAGLIVIVLDAIQALGHGDAYAGFRGMLAATVMAGIIQMAFGGFKLARKGLLCPSSVIHGMMAAIGVIIISKQIHVLFGYTPHAKKPIMLLTEIPQALMGSHGMSLLIGGLSLMMLLSWSKIPVASLNKVPAPLVAVIVGVAAASFFGFPSSKLLSVPGDISSWLIFPDFSVLATIEGWRYTLTIALVGSLETTLSAAAVDKIDPQKRHSDLDRDLLSKGACNAASGLIGGLPMIAEIVRSSANISYGAKTWRSNFIHGLCVMLAVLIMPSMLNMIPLASLAAILVVVGSRLGSPGHLVHAKHIGYDHLVGFATTMILTLAVDLLVGIMAGAVVQYLISLYLGMQMRDSLDAHYIEKQERDSVLIVVDSALTFCNFGHIREMITGCLEKRQNVKIDMSECSYIDHDVIEQIEDLQTEFKEKGLHLDTGISQHHHRLGTEHSSGMKKAA